MSSLGPGSNNRTSLDPGGMLSMVLTPVTSGAESLSAEPATDRQPGFVLLVVAAVLGSLALLLGLIYTYIYCTKIRPRPRMFTEDRISYYAREASSHSAQNDKDQQERLPIKAHPFFVLSYLSRLKSGDHHSSQHPSTSTSRRY